MGLVTLVSGGIDSTLMSVMAHEEDITLHPLFVDYGQLGAVREWATCRLLHERHGLPMPKRMDLSGYGEVVPSGITNREMRIYEDAFLPGRNLLLILSGAAYAHSTGADGVAIGLLDPEHCLFPDQTLEFLEQCENIIEVTLGRRISVVAPLLGFSKKAVLALAKAKGIHDTYSCHAGGDAPCGLCVACVEIANARGGR